MVFSELRLSKLFVYLFPSFNIQRFPITTDEQRIVWRSVHPITISIVRRATEPDVAILTFLYFYVCLPIRRSFESGKQLGKVPVDKKEKSS